MSNDAGRRPVLDEVLTAQSVQHLPERCAPVIIWRPPGAYGCECLVDRWFCEPGYVLVNDPHADREVRAFVDPFPGPRHWHWDCRYDEARTDHF
jgi:hypothetical protein